MFSRATWLFQLLSTFEPPVPLVEVAIDIEVGQVDLSCNKRLTRIRVLLSSRSSTQSFLSKLSGKPNLFTLAQLLCKVSSRYLLLSLPMFCAAAALMASLPKKNGGARPRLYRLLSFTSPIFVTKIGIKLSKLPPTLQALQAFTAPPLAQRACASLQKAWCKHAPRYVSLISLLPRTYSL